MIYLQLIRCGHDIYMDKHLNKTNLAGSMSL
jgi:hypothetical protein